MKKSDTYVRKKLKWRRTSMDFFKRDRKIPVTTTVLQSLREAGQKKGIRVGYALNYGYRVLLGLESAASEESREEVKRLRDKLIMQSQRVFDLEMKMEKLGVNK